MKYTIREMTAQEYPLLDDFLYEAIFVPEGVDPPSKSIITALNCRFMLRISERQKMILH